MVEITKLLQSTNFFRLLAETVLKENYATFSFVCGELLADGSYFILYKSQLHAVLLEIQPKVTKESMKCSIEKCLGVFDRFNIEPLLVILTDRTSSSVRSMLSPISEKPHWQTSNSTAWAEECLTFSKDTASFSEDEASKFDPLMVFTFYFFVNEIERQKLRDIDNPMINHIYDF